MRCRRRKSWRNHTGNQRCDPLQICRPESLQDLVELVQEAERVGSPVRAVGSGHSWSDVALTGGFLVEPTGLARWLDLEGDLLRPEADRSLLVRVEAGIRVRELNANLDERGLALSQMGGYDGQTVAGVVSTSTHGSGLGFGPLSDFVVSMDVVASGGGVHRIERSDGPTDDRRYRERHPDRGLVKDDRWFNAAAVAMGCMGLIYAVILQVEPEYWLKEVRKPATWEEVARDLRTGEVLRRNRHYEVYFNPYRGERGHRCLVTTRNKTEREGRRPRDRRRNSLPEFLAMLPVTAKVLNLIVDLRPSLSPRLLDWSLGALADDEYTSASYKVLNIGSANLLPAYSAEIGVPVDERGSHIEAVERIFRVADKHREVGSVYHTAPISLRFVKASEAYLSMMEGRNTMMIELIQLTRTEGGFELLADYEDALYDLGGRPHWGQVNSLTERHIASLYPKYGDWQDVHRRLNASGVFDSPFSNRVGIS